MSYPVKSELKAKLASQCQSEELCEKIANDFAGKPISCSHRVPQKIVFDEAKSLKVDQSEASKCANALCSFVDNATCKK